jgi:predicted DNA binding CopG/RHH family protein
VRNDTTALVQLEMGLWRLDSLTEKGKFESSGLVTGERVSAYMSKKIKYTDEPLGDLEVIEDFLPSPQELTFKDDNIKITIALSRSSVEFFKKEAKKQNTQYQKMIRRLLDAYTVAHLKSLTKGSSGRS